MTPDVTTVGPRQRTGQPALATDPHRAWSGLARWWHRSSLVARFIAVSLLLTLGVGLLAAQVVTARIRSTALSQEAEQVAFDVTKRVEGGLLAADLQRPLTTERRAEIDTLVKDRALGPSTVAASMWRADRVVAYSTDPSSDGTAAATDENLEAALAGHVSKEIKSAAAVDIQLDPTGLGEVMEIYVPLRLRGSDVLGAFELYRDLRDVNERVAEVQKATFLALGGGLAVLFGALLLVVRGASGQLRRQSDELAQFEARQEVNRRQTEFVGIVSHELRTPLTALLGFSELLLSENVDDNDRREWTTLLHSGAQRLRHLVEQLLDVSRIDHGRLELHLAAVSVEVAASEAMHSFAALPSGLKITQRFEADLPAVLADHEKLVQILTNLVSNAVKYSPDGGTITVDGRRNGSSVWIYVTDQGLGIPPGELTAIFERFHRVDDERRRAIDGTGLGLYITRQLVEMHGGTVAVHSLGPRRGSTFTLKLPVADGPLDREGSDHA